MADKHTPTVEETLRVIRKIELCESDAAKLILMKHFAEKCNAELLEGCELARNECLGLAAYLGTCSHDVILDNLQTTIASLEGKVEMLSAAIRKAKGE